MESTKPAKSLRKTATAGVFWTFSQQFGSQGIAFVVSIFLARILLPEEFGLIGMITVFMAVGQTLIDSGLTQSLIRTEQPDQADYSTVFFFNLGGSVLIYALLYLTAPLVADFYGQEVLTGIVRLYGITFIINAFSTVQLTRLTKKMDFKTQLMVSLPSLVVSGLFGIYLAYQGHGVWSLVWMSISQSFLKTIQLWYRTKWRPSFTFNTQKFKHHFNFGYKLTLSGLLDTVFKNIYQIIIGKFFLASHVGFYTRANTLKQLPVTNLSSALNKVTYPLFASIQNDDTRLRSVYKEIMQMVVFVIAPVLIIMGVVAEPLFRFLFTEKWLPAVPYFQILCLVGILYPVHSYNLNVLKVKGRSDLFLKLEIIKKINQVAVISVSIQYGIMGLIWGQLFNTIVSFFINTYFTGKFIRYNAFQQAADLLPILLLAFLSGAGVWLMDQYTPIHHWLDIFRLLVLGGAGAGCYLALAYLFKMNSLQSIQKILIKK